MAAGAGARARGVVVLGGFRVELDSFYVNDLFSPVYSLVMTIFPLSMLVPITVAATLTMP